VSIALCLCISNVGQHCYCLSSVVLLQYDLVQQRVQFQCAMFVYFFVYFYFIIFYHFCTISVDGCCFYIAFLHLRNFVYGT